MEEDLSNELRPILHILVVGFHHQRGAEVRGSLFYLTDLSLTTCEIISWVTIGIIKSTHRELVVACNLLGIGPLLHGEVYICGSALFCSSTFAPYAGAIPPKSGSFSRHSAEFNFTVCTYTCELQLFKIHCSINNNIYKEYISLN